MRKFFFAYYFRESIEKYFLFVMSAVRRRGQVKHNDRNTDTFLNLMDFKSLPKATSDDKDRVYAAFYYCLERC